MEPTPVVQGPPEKPGRKPYHVRFPNMAERALEYSQQHGWSAQERRRSDVATSVGVSLVNIFLLLSPT